MSTPSQAASSPSSWASPASTTSRISNTTQATDQSSPPPPPPSPPRTDNHTPPRTSFANSAEEIEYLTRTAFAAPSNKDYPAWFSRSHVARDFRADFDGVTGSQNWTEHVATYRRIAAANPDYRPHLAEVSVDVDESNGRAEAYCLVHNAGRMERAKLQTMGVLTWQRSGGVWRLWRIKTMRGSDCFF